MARVRLMTTSSRAPARETVVAARPLIDPAPDDEDPACRRAGRACARRARARPRTREHADAVDAGLGVGALADAQGLLEQRAQRAAGLAVGLGRAQGVAQLAEDLALADGHRVQAAGDREGVGDRAVLVVHVEVLAQVGERHAGGRRERVADLGRRHRGTSPRRRRPRPGCRWPGRPPRRCSRRCGPCAPARRARSASSATDSSTLMGADRWDSPRTTTLTGQPPAAPRPRRRGADAAPRALGEGLALFVEGEDLQLGGQVHLAHVDAVGDGQDARREVQHRADADRDEAVTHVLGRGGGGGDDADRDAALGAPPARGRSSG